MQCSESRPLLSALAIAAALCAQATLAQGVAPAAPAAPAESTGEPAPETRNELPTTKEVTSGQALQQTRDYDDVARRQAGVTQSGSVGANQPQYNIRGIRANAGNNFRLDGGVPVVLNQPMPTEDKARIETLKGANALVFGVASPAGIINMVPKRAEDRDVTSLTLSGNGFGQYAGHVDIGRRFGESKQVGLRVNASGTHLENGVKGLDGTGKFGSVGWDWRVNSQLTVQGDLEYYTRQVSEQAQIAPPAAVNGVIINPQVPDPRLSLLGPNGNWAIYTPRTAVAQLRADYRISESWSGLLQVGRVDANRRRHQLRIAGYVPTTGANGTVVDQISDVDNSAMLVRIELSGRFSTGPLTHRLTAGVSSGERTNDVSNATVPITQRQNIYAPVDIPEVSARPLTKQPGQTSADKALYAYDTIGVLPKVKLLAGMRLTRATDSIEGKPDAVNTVTSPAVGVLWELRPTTTLYASYMSGLESGGQAPTTAANANFVLAPTVSKQKEVGIRDSSIGGLTLNAAYFDIRRPNAVVDPATNVYGYNGDSTYQGVEATARYNLRRNWQLSGSLQWLNARQHAPLQPTIDGRVPLNTPEWSGNVGVAHRPDWMPGLTLRTGLSTISQRALNAQNQGFIPGYTLYNLGATYDTRIMGKRTSFLVQIDNAANKRYWSSVTDGGLYGIGMDRSIRVAAKTDF